MEITSLAKEHAIAPCTWSENTIFVPLNVLCGLDRKASPIVIAHRPLPCGRTRITAATAYKHLQFDSSETWIYTI